MLLRCRFQALLAAYTDLPFVVLAVFGGLIQVAVLLKIRRDVVYQALAKRLHVTLAHRCSAGPCVGLCQKSGPQLIEAGLMLDHPNDVRNRMVVIEGDSHLAILQLEHAFQEFRSRRHDTVGLAESKRLGLVRSQAYLTAGKLGEWVGTDHLDRLVFADDIG